MEFVKFKVVTVEDPALKFPVSAMVVPVAFVKLTVAIVECPVTPRFVDVVLVPVALVKTRPVIVPLDETMLVIVPFVT